MDNTSQYCSLLSKSHQVQTPLKTKSPTSTCQLTSSYKTSFLINHFRAKPFDELMGVLQRASMGGPTPERHVFKYWQKVKFPNVFCLDMWLITSLLGVGERVQSRFPLGCHTRYQSWMYGAPPCTNTLLVLRVYLLRILIWVPFMFGLCFQLHYKLFILTASSNAYF